MRIIEPEVQIFTPLTPDLLVHIERAGRTCYKSEREFTWETADKFVRMLISRGHESVLEHSSVTVKFIVDRGVSHEIVRHRIAAYSQESTRYCNYSKEKFGNEITFIKPFFFDRCEKYGIGKSYHLSCRQCDQYAEWLSAMQTAELSYMRLIEAEAKPEQARSILPNSLKTEIVCTFNLREWRHFFKLRCAPAAHPQMREVTLPLFYEFKDKIPALVDDIVIDDEALKDIPFAEVTYNCWGQMEPGIKFLIATPGSAEHFEITEWIKD